MSNERRIDQALLNAYSDLCDLCRSAGLIFEEARLRWLGITEEDLQFLQRVVDAKQSGLGIHMQRYNVIYDPEGQVFRPLRPELDTHLHPSAFQTAMSFVFPTEMKHPERISHGWVADGHSINQHPSGVWTLSDTSVPVLRMSDGRPYGNFMEHDLRCTWEVMKDSVKIKRKGENGGAYEVSINQPLPAIFIVKRLFSHLEVAEITGIDITEY